MDIAHHHQKQTIENQLQCWKLLTNLEIAQFCTGGPESRPFSIEAPLRHHGAIYI